jgi:hypothetical protein
MTPTPKVTLIIDSSDFQGKQFSYGLVRIIPSMRIPSPPDQALFERVEAVVNFSKNQVPQIDLYPNDLIGPQQDNGSPGWAYKLYYEECPVNSSPWSFYLLSTNGIGPDNPQRLSSLAEAPVEQPGQQYSPLASGIPEQGDVQIATGVGQNTVWGSVGSLGDSHFTYEFSVSTEAIVNHELGKYPAVTVIDSAGSEVHGAVNYISPNQLTVTFSAPFSGTVFCN